MGERSVLPVFIPASGRGRGGVGCLAWLLLCVFASLAGVTPARPGDAPPAPLPGLEARAVAPRLVIDWRDGQLSVSAREAPWEDVLPVLERHTGVQIRVRGRLAGTFTQAFQALPLEQGLRRLFREMNTAFFYVPGPPWGGCAADGGVAVPQGWWCGGTAAPIAWKTCRHGPTGGARCGARRHREEFPSGGALRGG